MVFPEEIAFETRDWKQDSTLKVQIEENGVWWKGLLGTGENGGGGRNLFSESGLLSPTIGFGSLHPGLRTGTYAVGSPHSSASRFGEEPHHWLSWAFSLQTAEQLWDFLASIM